MGKTQFFQHSSRQCIWLDCWQFELLVGLIPRKTGVLTSALQMNSFWRFYDRCLRTSRRLLSVSLQIKEQAEKMWKSIKSLMFPQEYFKLRTLFLNARVAIPLAPWCQIMLILSIKIWFSAFKQLILNCTGAVSSGIFSHASCYLTKGCYILHSSYSSSARSIRGIIIWLPILPCFLAIWLADHRAG